MSAEWSEEDRSDGVERVLRCLTDADIIGHAKVEHLQDELIGERRPLAMEAVQSSPAGVVERRPADEEHTRKLLLLSVELGDVAEEAKGAHVRLVILTVVAVTGEVGSDGADQHLDAVDLILCT